MTKTAPFHERSLVTPHDPALARDRAVIPASMDAPPAVFHDNDTCPDGRQVPADAREPGDGGYERCPICAQLD
jgi:hypothetical protein